MKLPQLSVALSSATAAALLCFGIFQACQPMTPSVGSSAPLPGGPDPLRWYEAEPVRIVAGSTDAQKESILKKALKLGKKSKTRFCRGKNKCVEVPPVASSGFGEENTRNVASIIGDIRTVQVTDTAKFESGGGDEPPPTDGIHVAQFVDFATPDEKVAFNKELGY
jgi:hypothetical protein